MLDEMETERAVDPLEGAAEVSAPASAPSETLHLNGEAVEIPRMRMRQVLQVLPEARPVWKYLRQQAAQEEQPMVEVVIGALMEHSAPIARICAIATDRDMEWIEQLLPQEFAQLALAVVRVNRDFFIQMIQTILAGTAGVRTGA